MTKKARSFYWHGRRHSVGMGVDNEAKLLKVKNLGSKQKSLVKFGP